MAKSGAVRARSIGVTGSKKTGAKASTINAWQDDPEGLPNISRPVPKLATPPLKYKFKGKAPKAGAYAPGTSQFRYWTAAEALRRGADFWAPRLGVSRWQQGATLSVGLDEGDDLNAYYDRSELAFFHHQGDDGTVFYSGESPDVVCHEMGHACLDAHQPNLWDAPYIEAGSFHESFGDMSAILSALQLPSVRTKVLSSVKSYRASSLSRVAEQLGTALRQIDPSIVDPDCLRNAWNKFTYVDPNSLPDDAPASKLCAEVHSFSRVFTGAFYEILSGMLEIQSKSPTESDLAAIAADVALLLIDATGAAPIQPNYYAQVAAHMIDSDTKRFSGKYRSALVDTFVSRKIIPKNAVTSLNQSSKKTAKSVVGVALAEDKAMVTTQTHHVEVRDKRLGLGKQALIVAAPYQHRSFLAISASITHDAIDPTNRLTEATQRFVGMLLKHDRIDTGTRKHALRNADATSHIERQKTHVVVKDGSNFKLIRRKFACSAQS